MIAENTGFIEADSNRITRNNSLWTLLPDFVSGDREEDEMNQIILNMENSITPKAIPVIVPLAYQAILNLQERINQAKAVLIKAGRGTSKRDEDGIPLWQRYSLSVPEAAKYFGIGETRLYQIVAEHPGADFILEIGSHVKIKRVLFERFLDAASCV